MNPLRTLLALASISALAIAATACGSDDGTTTSEAQTSSTTTEQTTTTQDTNGRTTETTQPPKDEGTVITLKGGQPDGGLKKIKAKKDDKVKITVETDEDVGEIHLHGYDLMKDAAPGQPAVFEFDAKIQGIFTIEIEDSATEIAELEVS